MDQKYFEMLIRKAAYDKKIEYDELSEREQKQFIKEVLESKISKLVLELGEEVKSLSKAEQYELVMVYMFNYETI